MVVTLTFNHIWVMIIIFHKGLFVALCFQFSERGRENQTADITPLKSDFC